MSGIGSRSMRYKNVTYRWSWHESKRLWETWGDVVTPLCPHYRLCIRKKIKAEGCKTFVFMLLLCPWFRKAAVWTVHKEMSINKLHMTALVAWLFHVVPHTACLQNSQLLKGTCCKFQDSAAICNKTTALRFAGYQYHRSTIEVPKLCTEHVVERCRQLGESPDCWPRFRIQGPIPRKAGKNNHNPKFHFGSLSYKHDSCGHYLVISYYLNILTASDGSLVLHSTDCRRWLKCQEKTFQRTFLNGRFATKYRAVSWAAGARNLHRIWVQYVRLHIQEIAISKRCTSSGDLQLLMLLDQPLKSPAHGLDVDLTTHTFIWLHFALYIYYTYIYRYH